MRRQSTSEGWNQIRVRRRLRYLRANHDHALPPPRVFVLSIIDHDSSGTASQVTPQGRSRANANGCKVGFELPTNSIQFYVFAKWAPTSLHKR